MISSGRSIHNFMKSEEQEVDEVAAGTKPAALISFDVNSKKYRGHTEDGGKWESLFFVMLVPVYGRYYNFAVAKTEEKVFDLARWYYYPICQLSDIAIGNALGYDSASIAEYCMSMNYADIRFPSLWKHRAMKFVALFQKYGAVRFAYVLIGFLFNNRYVMHGMKKEGWYGSRN